MWPEINLKVQFVRLAVSIQIIGLRGKLFCPQYGGIFFQRTCVARCDNHGAGCEVRRNLPDLRDGNDDVRGFSRMVAGVGNGNFNIFDLRRALRRSHAESREDPQRCEESLTHKISIFSSSGDARERNSTYEI